MMIRRFVGICDACSRERNADGHVRSYSKLRRQLVADGWLIERDFILCPKCKHTIKEGRR